MSKRTDHTSVWYINLSAGPSCIRKLSDMLGEHQISIEQWHNKTDLDCGLILIAGNEQLETLIDLLNIQFKNKASRIIVLNTSPDTLSKAEVMKIFGFGAEYYLESAAGDTIFDCIIGKIARWRCIETILRSPWVKTNIIGESRLFKKLIRDVIEVSLYSDSSVLILGERGTGKELIAKLIHEIDKRRNQSALVLIDCTTIRHELSGSEFFGHEKGAYTGADHMREGAFSLADNGTLFLDEVGELPLPMQAELLRVIQEGTYKKLGSNTWRQTNFRLVCATNRNLENEAEQGNFRKDLHDRISLWKCFVPNLNDREEDIPALVNFFIRKKFTDGPPVIDDAVMDYLKERHYSGNIRELQNLITRISFKYVGKGPVTIGDIPDYDRQNYIPVRKCWHENPDLAEAIALALQDGHDAKSIMDTVKSLITKTAMAFTGSNKEVSQLLGKSERWIQLQKAKER